jgi:hypothetical protein
MNGSAGRAKRGVAALVGFAVVVVIGACSPGPTPSLPSRMPVALGPIALTGVGDVQQGGASAETIVIRVTEVGPATITAGAGSFQVTLTDHAGLPDTVSFTGTPTASGPGSLGVTAALTRANVLTVEIVDSDTLNIEPITIEGLGVRALSSAAIGPVNAVLGGCAGSLAGCAATNVLPSPASVVAGS